MKLIAPLTKKTSLEILKAEGVQEVILSAKEISRLGEFEFNELEALARKAQELGLTPFLEWDILQTQTDFAQTTKLLSTIDLSLFAAVRVQDMGAYFYLLKNSSVPIHLILETAYHNFPAIQEVASFGGERVHRVVLSLELPEEILHSYLTQLKNLHYETEFLGLGPILLFYTPRKLLSVQYYDHEDGEVIPVHQKPKELYADAKSEESPHTGFPVVENHHGTFMFNTKDHFVLEAVEKFQQLGLTALRVETRLGLKTEVFKLIKNLMENPILATEFIEELKTLNPRKVIRGFYNANRTDRLFPKLKNQRLLRHDENFLGEVVDSEKGSHIGVVLKSKKATIAPGDFIKFVTPDGREKRVQISTMTNSKLDPLKSAEAGDLIFLPWVGAISRKTMVYLG